MRLIKFRAYDSEAKEMVYSQKTPYDYWFSTEVDGIMKCFINHVYSDNFGDEHDDWQPLDNIMESLDIPDITGKDVYEGDIVRITDEENIFVIRYDSEKKSFVLDEYGIKGAVMEYGFDEYAGEYGKLDTYSFDGFENIETILEVIGNIYENPTFLKGEM